MADIQRDKLLVTRKSSPSLLARRKNKHTPMRLPRDLKKDKNSDRVIRANPDKRQLQTKPYLIIENGINATPRGLADFEFASRDAPFTQSKPHHSQLPLARKLFQLPSIDSISSTRSIQSVSSRFSVRRSLLSQASVVLSLGSIDISRENISFAAAADLSDQEDDDLSYQAPSMFRLREDPTPRLKQLQTKFKINLVETETTFHLQLPSLSDSLDTEYGKEISNLNDAYDRSIEKSKALSHIAVQTTSVFWKHRKLYKPRNKRLNAETFASVWDMYDTYLALGLRELSHESQTTLSSRAEGRVEKIVVSDEQKEYESNFEFCGKKFDRRFLNALMIAERLITRRIYCENQLRYLGLLVQDPFSTTVNYNYTLTHLWTFNCKRVGKRCVTSISWNSKNKNIVAVGYGKFKFSTKCDGLVCIWNVKCPITPERWYDFPDDPVTFVAFSNCRWHILAVTFYSGSVLLIDTVARSLLVKANNHHYPLYYPVRQARWFPHEHKATVLITCGKGGKVFRYKKSEFFLSNKIMTLGRPHGKIHGIEQPRKCYARRVLASRQPAAEVLVQHPVDPQVYLVGSAEGCVYVCSVQHRHDYKEIFVAHNGPVYNIQFNPFCAKIFLTCGADWCIRIWAESVFQPLITLESGMSAIQDALWSPLHSTVIVSTTGTYIELWDIRRRISKPMSSTQTPSMSYNNVLMFSLNKFNLCIGDTEGNVHVMALSEMPFSPTYQEAVLVEAIYCALTTRPEVLNILRKLGPPFTSRRISDDYITKLYKKLNKLHEFVV